MKTMAISPAKKRRTVAGMALVMVLLVLSALAILGTPFVISMNLQERSSFHFDGEVKVRLATEAAAHHAMAKLTKSVRAAESAEEARERGVFDGQSARGTTSTGTKRLRRSRTRSGRGGIVARGKSRGARRGTARSGRRGRREEEDEDDRRSPLWRSERGALQKNFDNPDELKVSMPSTVVIPASAPRVHSEYESSIATQRREVTDLTVDFQDQRGISASVEVVDEQGKININTAPPNLIANLFGVSRLKSPLEERDRVIELEDGSAFATDSHSSTIDGAVIVLHPVTGRAEAITYQARTGDTLEGVFRGAFFSLPATRKFPRGSFVYDLRGWKAGYHRLRAGSINGFVTRELAEFSTVEAIREIANWQMSALFLERLGGQRLTESFLQENGVRARDLEKSGIDPSLFQADRRYSTGIFKIRLEDARKSLRSLRIRRSLIDKLENARGPRAVVALAARLEGLDRKAAKKVSKSLEVTLKKIASQSPSFDRKYLRACLANLARVQKSSGVETIRPEDLEQLRDAITVHSWVPSRWSESQILPDPILPGDQSKRSYRIERPGSHGGGSIVRLRHRESDDIVELNQTIQRGKGVAKNGFSLVFPVFSGFASRTARVDFLERHPINVNTASLRVLTAVFTGIRDARSFKRVENKTPGLVTPAEARALARHVASERPFSGPSKFRDAVFRASERRIINEKDVESIYINSLQPNHYRLRTATTSFCYATGDVYTVRGRGILRNLAGGEVTSTAFREIVEISPPHTQQWTLFGQSDFSSEIYVRSPYRGNYPEDHFSHSITLPGSHGHLVRSTPILTKLKQTVTFDDEYRNRSHAFYPVPGGELSGLRLESPETPDFPFDVQGIGQTFHFRDERDEMMNLSDGEPYAVDIRMDLEDGQDLTNTLGSSVEAWIRFRTFPDTTDEGMFYVMDSGVEARRNRLSVLYDQQTNEWVARIYDSTAPDPSFETASSDVHQWVELRHSRVLELNTWYHVRLAWDGAYAGGVQLFIDGFPAEGSNLRSELTRNLSIERDSLTRGDVRDWLDKFPAQGVLRIGQELLEYDQPGHLRKWYDGRGPGGGYASYFDRYATESLSARLKFLNKPAVPPPTGSATTRGARAPNANHVNRGYIDRDNGNRRGSTVANHQAGAGVTLHGYSLELRKRIEVRAPDGKVTVHEASGEEIILGEGGLRLADDLLPANLPEYFTGTSDEIANAAPNLTKHFRPVRIVNYAEQRPLEDGPRMTVERLPDGRPVKVYRWAHAASGQRGQSPGILTPVFYLYLHSIELNSPENRRLLPETCASLLLTIQNNAPFAGVEIYTSTLMIDGQPLSVEDFFQRRGVVAIGGMSGLLRYELKSPIQSSQPAANAILCTALVDQGNNRGSIDDPVPINCAQLNALSVSERTRVRVVSLFCGPAQESLRAAGAYPSGRVASEAFQHARSITLSSILATGQLAGRYPRTGVIELRGFPSPWQAAGDPLKNLAPRPGDLQSLSTGDLFQQHPDDTTEWIRYYDIDRDMFVAHPHSAFRDFPRAGNQERLRRSLESNNQTRLVRRVENQLSHPAGTPIFQVVEVNGGGLGFGDYVTVTSSDPDFMESRAWRIYNVLEMSHGRFLASVTDPFGQNSSFEHSYTRSMRPRLEKFPSGFPPRVGRGSLTFFGDSVVDSPTRGTPTAYSFEEEITSGFVVDEIRRTHGGRLRRDIRHVIVPVKSNGNVEVDSNNNFRVIRGQIEQDRNISADSPIELLVVSVGYTHQDFVTSEERGVLRINEELFFFENPDAGGGSDAQEGGDGRLMRFEPRQQGAQFLRSLATPEPGMRLARWDLQDGDSNDPKISVAGGRYEEPGFLRLQANQGDYEIMYYEEKNGNKFKDCLRGQFHTPMITSYLQLPNDKPGQATIRDAGVRLRLVGRGLLGSPRQQHSLGDPVVRVNYLPITQINGPMTETGLPVAETRNFPNSGYLLLDPARGTRDYEIIAYTGRDGEGLFHRPRGEDGRGILRQRFGTVERAINTGMFAYALPFRHFDRYEPQAESEDIAHFQKSLRVPGAYWKSITWRERASPSGQERLCDVVVAARFDGTPEWNAKPSNEPGGLYVFDARDIGSPEAPVFPLDVAADQIDVRIYFRYQEGAFQFLDNTSMRDDWKETAVLEVLIVEYDKAGRVLRYEETDF